MHTVASAISTTCTSMPLCVMRVAKVLRFACTSALSSSMLPEVSTAMMMSAGWSCACADAESAAQEASGSMLPPVPLVLDVVTNPPPMPLDPLLVLVPVPVEGELPPGPAPP
ncbi:MAG: hypothetical protein QM820_13580 [Minicystis sp.]